MKKALGILSVLVLITVMMISCNAEQKLDDTVGVSFNVSNSRELSVANESFVAVDSADLTWYYHGEKKTDTQFITGQSGTGDDYWTRISTGDALANTYVKFSQGQWSFEIKAVSTAKNKQVYYGRTNANVLLTKENRTISISVSPFVSGVNGTLVLSNVYIAPQNSNEKVGPNELYINGTPIESTNYTIVDYEGGKAISYTNEVAPGTYTVEVKRVGEDTGVVLASASKTVVVYSGLTTTISGSVEEDTTSGRFDVNDDFVINTKEDLILFRDLVNEVGMNFSGKTVKLANNIDLADVDWKPIGQTEKTTFQGVFDGQGYTISNMTVNNSDTSANCSSGFFGWIEDHGVGIVIKNTKFDNAHVEGNHNVGVVAGYIYGTIYGCEVTNSTIIAHNANDDANGDKVGGIAGYVGEDAFIDNNKVVNCEINGNRDIGGIAGAVGADVDSFRNNNVKDTQIIYITEKSYASAAEIVSGRTGFVPDNSNTYNNVTILKSVITFDELNAVIENGGSIILNNDIDAGNTNESKLSITSNTFIDGNGKTITTNDPNKEAYASRVIDMSDLNNVTLSIEDATITGGTVSGQYPYLYRGISLYNNINPVLNISNTNIIVGHYAVNIAGDNTNASINAYDSTFSGYTAFQTWSPNTIGKFKNTTFKGINQWNNPGDNDFATVVVNTAATDSSLTFDECRFIATENGNAREYFLSLRTDCVVHLNNCTFVKNDSEISVSDIFANLQKTEDEDIYNDYIYIYGGTNVSIYVNGELISIEVN
ncbi:MAG: hypothetical protein ACI4NI_09820 [Candidatus Ornithospirochaeta sp.]